LPPVRSGTWFWFGTSEPTGAVMDGGASSLIGVGLLQLTLIPASGNCLRGSFSVRIAAGLG
jgi:hypothetical protein